MNLSFGFSLISRSNIDFICGMLMEKTEDFTRDRGYCHHLRFWFSKKINHKFWLIQANQKEEEPGKRDYNNSKGKYYKSL